jgi:hypothetical protein
MARSCEENVRLPAAREYGEEAKLGRPLNRRRISLALRLHKIMVSERQIDATWGWFFTHSGRLRRGEVRATMLRVGILDGVMPILATA